VMLLMMAAIASTSVIASAATVKVGMKDTPPVFVPEKIKIKAGDTVEWENNAATLHTVTFDASKEQIKGDVVLPAGVKPFDSGFMMPGGKFSYKFTVPGEYKYFCIPHEKDGMIGYVTVTK
jgi:plastocyanin